MKHAAGKTLDPARALYTSQNQLVDAQQTVVVFSTGFVENPYVAVDVELPGPQNTFGSVQQALAGAGTMLPSWEDGDDVQEYLDTVTSAKLQEPLFVGLTFSDGQWVFSNGDVFADIQDASNLTTPVWCPQLALGEPQTTPWSPDGTMTLCKAVNVGNTAFHAAGYDAGYTPPPPTSAPTEPQNIYYAETGTLSPPIAHQNEDLTRSPQTAPTSSERTRPPTTSTFFEGR